MKYIIIMLLCLFSKWAFPNSVTTLSVTVRNQKIIAMDSSYGQLNLTGNNLLHLHDDYPSFKNVDLAFTNIEARLFRSTSLFTINMTGKKWGKTFIIKSKFASSSLTMAASPSHSWNMDWGAGGCSRVSPSGGNKENGYVIQSSSDVNMDCVKTTSWMGYSARPLMTSASSRDVYFDIGEAMKSFEYNSLPLDIYSGTVIYSGEMWISSDGTGLFPQQQFNFTIDNNSYFSGVSVSSSQVPFTVKNINESHGFSVLGNASVSFNLLGAFSEWDKIKIDVASANNYRLTSAGGSAIPYSVDLAFRGVNSPLVLQGNKQQPVIIEPGVMGSAVNGQLNFDFKTPANLVHNGLFTDNLTLIAELVL